MIGAIIGDVIGSAYEFNNTKDYNFPLFTKTTTFTDDTVMTIAIADILLNGYQDDNSKMVEVVKKWCRNYPDAGYGGYFYYWIFSNETKPYNSYGNGAAMRISSVGWIANSEEEVKDLSRKVTSITHNHEEGIKGAEVTAMCIYYTRIGKSKKFIHDYASRYYDVDLDYEYLRKINYHGKEICQITVPQAIYCFLISTDFVDCLRKTISIGGDSDTLAAISCAIAEAYYQEIPHYLVEEIKMRLTDEEKEIVDKISQIKYEKSINPEELNENTKAVINN